MYEPEICVPVNESLGLEHLDNLQNNHAPGVDNITTSMLKRAGAEALTCLTSLVNNNLHENQAPEVLNTRDVNVLIFLDFSFRYDSVHQKYKRLKRYVAHYKILWHRVTLRNEFSALEYLIQR